MSGADGKIGEASHPRNESAPTRDVASVQRIVIPRPTTSLSHILASLPNKVEVVRAWSEFEVSMSGSVRVWAAWAGDSLAIPIGLPVLAPSVATQTILIRACRERVRGNLELAQSWLRAGPPEG